MAQSGMKKVRICAEVYDAYRMMSEQGGDTITKLVDQALRRELARDKREAVREKIRQQARAFAGSSLDLDPLLSEASAEHLAEGD